MSQFMLAYHGGNQPKTKEEGMAHREKWMKWVEGLGDTVVNPGTPFKGSKIVSESDSIDDADPNSMMGFAVIEVENFEEALKIAKSDPFLSLGGKIRVSEMMSMGK